MRSEKLVQLSNYIHLERKWILESQFLESSIYNDLFFLIAFHTFCGHELTYKTIFLTCKFSKNAIRQNIKKLMSAGLVSIKDKPMDKRFKLVVGTEKMLDFYFDYLSFIDTHIKTLQKS